MFLQFTISLKKVMLHFISNFALLVHIFLSKNLYLYCFTVCLSFSLEFTFNIIIIIYISHIRLELCYGTNLLHGLPFFFLLLALYLFALISSLSSFILSMSSFHCHLSKAVLILSFLNLSQWLHPFTLHRNFTSWTCIFQSPLLVTSLSSYIVGVL